MRCSPLPAAALVLAGAIMTTGVAAPLGQARADDELSGPAKEALDSARKAFALRGGSLAAPNGPDAYRARLDETITHATRAAELAPKAERAFILIAKARFLKAELVTDEDDEDALWELYESGFHAAIAALRIDAKVAAKSEEDDIDDALSEIRKDQGEALHWCVSNYARMVERVNVFKQAFAVGRLRRMVARDLELDPEVYHGAPHRFQGAYCAEAPSMFGGSLELSKTHFEKAIEIEPRFVETRYMRAKFYAVATGDRELFKKEIEAALAVPDEALPAALFEQRYFKEKARALAKRESELFD